MIIYTRFIRPTMPAEVIRNVPAYVAPVVERARRKGQTDPLPAPIKPDQAARGHAGS